MTGETVGPAEELRCRSLQQRNAALNRCSDIGQLPADSGTFGDPPSELLPSARITAASPNLAAQSDAVSPARVFGCVSASVSEQQPHDLRIGVDRWRRRASAE